MKSFDECVASYRPVSSYSQKAISEELVDHLIETSKNVPMGFHLKPSHTFVVTDASLKKKIQKACFHKSQVVEAGAIVIFTGDRFCAAKQEVILDEELEDNSITPEEAERLRVAKSLHFDTSPMGTGWLGKLVGGPLLHLFSTMPQLPCIHKREWLTRQVMRSVMTFFWAAQSNNLCPTLIDSYDEWRIKWALSIPWNHIVVSVMLIGYASNDSKCPNPESLEANSQEANDDTKNAS